MNLFPDESPAEGASVCVCVCRCVCVCVCVCLCLCVRVRVCLCMSLSDSHCKYLGSRVCECVGVCMSAHLNQSRCLLSLPARERMCRGVLWSGGACVLW